MRLLVIEDEALLADQICARLEAEGWQVDTSGDGEDGLFQATEYSFDLAVVDLGLPGLPGLEVIRRLRAAGHRLPILILTARGKWEERVQGLEAGADDYMVKPFHPEELVARIKAITRRAAGSGGDVLTIGPLMVDTAAQRVAVDGMAIDLTTYEYRLLEYLARHAGEVASKRELADHLYPHDEDPDSNVIEVLIARLRRKLDRDGTQRPIETVRGRGYRLTTRGDWV